MQPVDNLFQKFAHFYDELPKKTGREYAIAFAAAMYCGTEVSSKFTFFALGATQVSVDLLARSLFKRMLDKNELTLPESLLKSAISFSASGVLGTALGFSQQGVVLHTVVGLAATTLNYLLSEGERLDGEDPLLHRV